MWKTAYLALLLHLLIWLNAAKAQADSSVVAVSPLAVTGHTEKTNPFVMEKSFEGSVVCAQDDSRYTAAGFNWPWQNVLTVATASSEFVRSVSTPRYNFVFNTRWMSRDNVFFQYGTNDASFALYSVALWNTKSAQAQPLLSGLNWKIVQPSPSGRYLSFIRGGQPIPGEGGATPASLCTLDLQTKGEKRWGEAEPLFGSVAWASDDTLLFSMAPSEAEQKAMRPADVKTKPLEWKPTIYAASLSTGQMRPLIQGAQRPAPSPDRKWLLSLSYCDPSPVKDEAPAVKADPTLPQAKAGSTLFLVLSRADGSEPHLVRREERGAPNIVWFPDSSGFALCDTRFAGGSEGKSAISVAISRYELVTATLARVGSFRYIAPVGTDMSEDERLWRPIAVTRDNRYLMSELTQFEAPPNNGLMLQRFDLQTGTTETVAHIGSVRGLDWRE